MPYGSLLWRLVIPLACVLVAYGGFNTYFAVQTQREEILAEATLSTVRLANTIRRSTRQAMLHSRREDVHKMIEDIGEQEGIQHVRILNKQGVITYSSNQSEIDQVNKRLYQGFNNGVYRCGFATTQVAYEHAVEQVFDSLVYMDKRLQRQPYLVGDQITETDIRAFVTLIRFDAAYYALFKANLRQVRDYSNLIDYMRRIYALPGIAETVNLEHIKAGYYSIRALNPSGIVPLGPASIWAPPGDGPLE